MGARYSRQSTSWKHAHKALTQFEETEKRLLKALPSTAVEVCQWTKVTVYRDCHVRFNKCMYSAPHTLVKQQLWLRVSETTIRLYQAHEMVAMHPRVFTAGQYQTITEHLPPTARAFLKHDPAWCRKQAQAIGPICYQIVHEMLNSTVVDYLRAAQSIIHLKQTFGQLRLEAACCRALAFGTPQYKSIKAILTKGLDTETLPEDTCFERLCELYLGEAIYCRDIKSLTH